MGFDSNRLQSEFSGDVNYLTRLNVLLYICDDSAMNLDVHTWFHALMALCRELSTEMTINKKTKECKEIEKAERFIEEINPLISESVGDANKSGSMKVSNELYHKVHTFEIYLRSILKSSGLQNKMKEDAGTALK